MAADRQALMESYEKHASKCPEPSCSSAAGFAIAAALLDVAAQLSRLADAAEDVPNRKKE